MKGVSLRRSPSSPVASLKSVLQKETAGVRRIVLGDMNLKDEEAADLCDEFAFREARYAGYSWGVRANKFDADLEYRGPGHRYDRVFFPDGVWAEAHLVG